MTKKGMLLLLIAVLFYVIAGCSKSSSEQESAPAKEPSSIEENQSEDAEPLMEEDGSGNEDEKDTSDTGRTVSVYEQNVYDKSLEILDLMYDLELGTNRSAIVDMAVLKAELEAYINEMTENNVDKKTCVTAKSIYDSVLVWNDAAIEYTAATANASPDKLKEARKSTEKAIKEYETITGITPAVSDRNEPKQQENALDNDLEDVNDTVSEEKEKIVLFRDDSFNESELSPAFSQLQRYLNYLGSIANSETLYLPQEMADGIDNIDFNGEGGTFQYMFSGPSQFQSDEKTICYVRYGMWGSNKPIDNDQCKGFEDLLTEVYGTPSVLFSDGTVAGTVESDQNYEGYHYALEWDDIAHYSHIFFSYYTNGTIKLSWSVETDALIGYEPVIATNKAAYDLAMADSGLDQISFVDVSDHLTIDNSGSPLKSSKCYVVKLDFIGNNNQVVPVYRTVIVLLGDFYTKQCYIDKSLSDEEMQNLYSEGKAETMPLENVFLSSDRADLVKYSEGDE